MNRAEKILGHMRQLGIHPEWITDCELLKMRNVGRKTVVEIRRLTGPCKAVEQFRYLYGFDAWWKHVGKPMRKGVRQTALAAWNATKDEPVVITNGKVNS
jgi:hypothetical protein